MSNSKNMDWIITKHIKSTDGKTEKIECEYRINFPPSRWNDKDNSPVIQLSFYDYKVESGWWLDDEETKWHTHPPHKHCIVNFNYFQRMPQIKLYDGKEAKYEDFTLEYCQKESLKIFIDMLNNVIKQCEI